MEEVADHAMALLRNPDDWEARARAAETVGHLKVSRAGQDLVNAMMDEKPIVREWAAWALGQIFGPASMKAFWAKERVVYAPYLKEEEILVLERIALGETQPTPLSDPDRYTVLPAPVG